MPDDFRFQVNGKPMAAKELKPGMKGQATVTTKTTINPVTVTDVREATVVSATETSMVVRGSDGVRRRFTQSELDKRGIEMIKDGRVVRISQLTPGDQLSATIITRDAPTVDREVRSEACGSQDGARSGQGGSGGCSRCPRSDARGCPRGDAGRCPDYGCFEHTSAGRADEDGATAKSRAPGYCGSRYSSRWRSSHLSSCAKRADLDGGFEDTGHRTPSQVDDCGSALSHDSENRTFGRATNKEKK